MISNRVDTVIIGAGPYGLSIAAHLKALGVKFRIFGSPMKFWRDMPKGIALKSHDFATNIYTPSPGYSLIEYCRARNINSDQPMDMEVFTEYGIWAQQKLVPEVEEVMVCRLSDSGGEFSLTLETGENITARRVVVAVGLCNYKRMPAELAGLPKGYVSHTSDVRDYAVLAGKAVTVIGRGTSALEAAGLLYERGAQPQLIGRGSFIWYGGAPSERRSLFERIKNPQSVVGPGRRNWVLQQAKTLMHYVPQWKRLPFTKTYLGPAGTWWLQEKIEGKVPVKLGTEIVAASVNNGRVQLTVRDKDGESRIETDHVVAGTGYEFAVDRIPMIAPALSRAIERIEISPKLSINFESSVKGLYFVGPISAYSFGPLVRFVCGAQFTAPKVARHIAKASRH